MRFTEIGQQLRAYRLESGMRAEEIAARLGVSRAALYRYEKGEVIKLDTIQRLAELLKISPLSLLGIGVEYYNRPVGYFERVRQIEETSEQILQVSGAMCYLTSSDNFDRAYSGVLDEMIGASTGDRAQLRAAADQVLGLQAARKRMYGQRRPSIIAIFPAGRLRAFLEGGVGAGIALGEPARRAAREAAAAEVEAIAGIMESEPIGLQFGFLQSGEPTGGFKILRARDRATLAVNPFQPDANPVGASGVAMITAAEEAIGPHQRMAETLWRESLKGAAAAAKVRQLVAAYRQG
jgi:transcriptional regulator with XRE-family HTH domain